MKKDGRVLIVDDDDDVLLAASLVLRKEYRTVKTIKDPARINQILRVEHFDVILLDMNFSEDITSGREGFFWLRNIKVLQPDTIVVLFTAYGGVEMAVKAIKEGAFDFVLKPWQNEKLIATIHAAMQLKNSKDELNELKSAEKQLVALINRNNSEFIGKSPAMIHVFETIEKVAPTDANVLISGENGTGKELVARALHQKSNRCQKPFISVDMGALSESLFESELFGHAKGSFTDAKDDKPGRFEVSSGGSIFLDEIGNLSLNLQAKLLAVLQNRKLTRLGENRERNFNTRVICATNANLTQEVNQGNFRQDLLYRLNTVEIYIPPLRERKEDIVPLTDYFLQLYSNKYSKQIKKYDNKVKDKLLNHTWPGNVRELQHAVERAIILSDQNVLTLNDFSIQSTEYLNRDNEEKLNLQELERRTIEITLQKSKGNISQAAIELGLSRAALYRRMEKYGL